MERAVMPAELLRQYSPEVVAKQTLAPGLMEHLKDVQTHHDERLAAVKKLFDAGVPMFVGSDGSGSPACWPGATYLDEMRLMFEAGIPPAQILLGATSGPAHFIDANADFGTIEPGKRADLVLLRGNPLEDIGATSNIAVVMQNGQLLERIVP